MEDATIITEQEILTEINRLLEDLDEKNIEQDNYVLGPVFGTDVC